MRPLHIFLLFFSVLGNFFLVKCLHLSNQVSDSICKQHKKFTESEELQKPEKSGSSSGNGGPCGWYQVKNGKDAGCSSSIVSDFIECRIIEQRKYPDLKPQKLTESRSGRIVGGEDAELYEFPSIVALSNVEMTQFCASTLISAEWVVTAAHCLDEDVDVADPNFKLIAGQYKSNETDQENPARQRRKVVAHKVHEKYDDDREQYDIAVIKVAPPFELNDKVNIAILPDPDFRADGVFTAAGWGTTKEGGFLSNTLQKVQLPFVNDESCNKTYTELNEMITEDMICAGGLPEGGTSTCQGDSGGPLYIDGGKQILVGITSWGKGCANPGIPGVSTEVAYYIDWIKKNTCIE